jgi:hypothetical protein
LPPATEEAAVARLPLLLALRGLVVTFGPSLLLDLFVLGSTIAALRGWLFRPQTGAAHLLRLLVALGAAFPWVHLVLVRPWMARWGATDAERRTPLPGDELIPEPAYQLTRAVTVRAPAAAVWPWLAQIGQARGGFYSYDWLENLAGCAIHSADRIHPEWHLRVGDAVGLMPVPGFGPRVAAVEPGRALVLAGWGTFAVEPVDATTSRLIARARQPRGVGQIVYALALEIPHFVMERRMLLGIKARAEGAVQRRPRIEGCAARPPVPTGR